LINSVALSHHALKNDDDAVALMRELAMFRRTLSVATICFFSVTIGPTVAAAQEVIKSHRPRIVGGERTTIEKHPWQVALNIRQRDGVYLCGGSTIAFKWVVTAAHCFTPVNRGRDAKVKAGATNYRTQGAPA
jgi:secreted trypsin-like serine protease